MASGSISFPRPVISDELFQIKYPLAYKYEESVANGEAVEKRFSTAFPS